MKKFLRRLFPSPEMRAFRKMRRRHRKELVKLVKETSEWDWGWLHDMIIMQIRHMHEYYSAGNNVWQSDETLLPTIEQLKHVLDLDEEIDKVYDDDFDAVFVHENGKITVNFPDSYWEDAKECMKREQELYEELYSFIGKNLRNWWD